MTLKILSSFLFHNSQLRVAEMGSENDIDAAVIEALLSGKNCCGYLNYYSVFQGNPHISYE